MDMLCVELRKVRKRHRCVWCGEWIEAGGTAEFQKVVFDGGLQNNYWHLECVEASGQEDMDPDEGFMPYSSPRGGHNSDAILRLIPLPQGPRRSA